MAAHFKSFIPEDTANEYLSIIEEGTAWYRFRPSPNSRLVSRWKPGDTLVDSIIQALTVKLQEEFNVKVGSIFLNFYMNGGDYCPYHKDRYGADVYTLTLGEKRDFLLKADRKGSRVSKISLGSGDLYVMGKALQLTHKHSVPKRMGANGKRISIVFFIEP